MNKNINKKILYLSAGIILYTLVGFIYYLALTTSIPLATVNVIWQVSTIILVSLVSAFYFKQKLSTNNIIGIIIVTIGSLFFIPETQATIAVKAITSNKGIIDTQVRYLKARQMGNI